MDVLSPVQITFYDFTTLTIIDETFNPILKIHANLASVTYIDYFDLDLFFSKMVPVSLMKDYQFHIGMLQKPVEND